VAVATVDAVAGDVPLVAELNRLRAGDAGLRHPRRAVHLVEEAKQTGDEKDGAKDADLCDCVGAAVKDLRHRSVRQAPSPIV
jgi:hypothetical protein